MKAKLLTLFALAAMLPAMAQRDTISLKQWQFSRDNLTPATATAGQGTWTTVSLPHDFQISQPWVAPSKDDKGDTSNPVANVKSRLSPRGFKEMGTGWYRLQLTPKTEWKGRRVMLELGGLMYVGDVYLNGQRIGGTEYGYVGFGIDLSKLLRYGQENTLVVMASTSNAQNSRWYTGGGLFRTVSLVVSNNELYFERHPLYITTSGNRTVNVSAEISKYGKRKRCVALTTIADAEGNTVATQTDTITLSPKRHTKEYQLTPITLTNPQLWDTERPYLYGIQVELADTDGSKLDVATDQFGVRTVEFTPQQGFLLNGKKVLLKGIANHHTLGALGAAAYPKAIEERIKLLKRFGFNHIRCSHNPYSKELYQLADRYGMLVIDELYDKWDTHYSGGRGEWMNHWYYDVPEWVKRDRNHPSVVLWSLGNELQMLTDLPFNDWGVTTYRMLRTVLMRYDSTRLTTVAMHPRGRNWQTDSLPCDLAKITDIQAYNYRYMYFEPDGRRFPNMIFYQSEANMSNMGPNYYGMNLNKVVGLAYWGMIDYLGESLGWPKKGWDNGAFYIDLRPKPQAWLLKSMFTDDPTVHIGIVERQSDGQEWNGIVVGNDKLTDHWNRQAGQKLNLYTFTNADEVELKLNGRSLGVKKNTTDAAQRNRIVWKDIEYQPGTLEAIARKDGRVVATHKIETAGKPVRLQLYTDDTALKAGKDDLAYVYAKAVDAKGRICPTAVGKVNFTLSGDGTIAATDNGDISSDELATDQSRSLFLGQALAIVKAGDGKGKLTLNAQADGLKSAKLTINVE